MGTRVLPFEAEGAAAPDAAAPAQAAEAVVAAPRADSGSPQRGLSRKERIWIFIEDNTLVNSFILLVIVFSTVCFVLETEFKQDKYRTMWFGFETFAVSVFSVEYTVRFFTCPRKRSFVIAPLNIVDLIAIVPYYITLFYSAALGVAPWEGGTGEIVNATAVFRAVRLFRVFRIFKLGRYSAGMQVFWGALTHSATSLFLLGFLMAITIILFSSVMYLVEGQGDWSEESCDPEIVGSPFPCAFRTIPTTFWWAIVTMTTVGYGDATPATTAGKVIAAATMICGIVVIALPISVLGNNFTKLMQQVRWPAPWSSPSPP
jgi:hypothetical protein